MRIDLYHGPQHVPQANRANGEKAATVNSPAPAPFGEDQAQLSGGHIQTAVLASQAAQLPEVREERIQALRHVIHNGEYHIDSQKLAGAILVDMAIGPVA